MTVLSRLAAHLTGRNLVSESEKPADDSASLPLPPIPLPEFATAEWLAERIDVTPRSLRHIHDQRRTLMESVGLESWPEKLETASDFADLFMRGFPCTADFTERCGKAAARQYERGTKKGKKVRFFERAIRMHWIKGMALANKKAKDKESLDPEVLLKDLAEGGHGQEASELAFLSLAEGGYDRGTAAAIKSNAPAFAPIMPTVRGMELHERRERLEGEGYGDFGNCGHFGVARIGGGINYGCQGIRTLPRIGDRRRARAFRLRCRAGGLGARLRRPPLVAGRD